MKLFIPILFLTFIAISSALPQSPSLDEKIEKVATFINAFPGSRDDLEKALKVRMEHKEKEMSKYSDEDMKKMIDGIASKLNGKVMSGDDFKKFVAAQMAAKA